VLLDIIVEIYIFYIYLQSC